MLEGPEAFTLFPELVCIEVLKVTVEGKLGYASQLVLILDSEKGKILYLPTDIFTETSFETLKKTSLHAIHLFGALGNLAVAIDTETGEVIERFNLDKLFAKEQPPEEPRVIH